MKFFPIQSFDICKTEKAEFLIANDCFRFFHCRIMNWEAALDSCYFLQVYFVFTGTQFIAPCVLPQTSKIFFCHLFIRGEYSLVELSVLMAFITCFPKVILASKKDLKRFQRAQKQFLTWMFIKIELTFVTNRLIRCRIFFSNVICKNFVNV